MTTLRPFIINYKVPTLNSNPIALLFLSIVSTPLQLEDLPKARISTDVLPCIA
jgi:hypothetical protein